MDKVIITHEMTEKEFSTTVTVPGEEPIVKRWVRTEGGSQGKFKLDWDEEPSLVGWGEVARLADVFPEFLY